MLQLRYLILQLADVLAAVRVVQLALDLSFFFLEERNMDSSGTREWL